MKRFKGYPACHGNCHQGRRCTSFSQVELSQMPGAPDPAPAPSPARKGFFRRMAGALWAWLTAPCL